VKLGRTSSDGRENLLAILGPARCSASSRCSTRPVRGQSPAVTDTNFAAPSRGPPKWLEGRQSPGAIAQIAGRLRKANGVNADLVFSDVPGRVAKALLDLADRFGRTADDSVHGTTASPGGARPAGRRLPRDNKALADFASAAGSASSPAPWSSWRSSASSAAPADPRRTRRRGPGLHGFIGK
jgi:hypothetical protein